MFKSIKSKAILISSYIIFIVALVVISIFYITWLNVKASTPTVDFSRDGDNISVSVSPRSGYELKFLGTTDTEQYWLYSTVADDSSCKAGSFGASMRAVWNTNGQVAEFTHDLSAKTNTFLCVKVLYGLVNNDNSWLEYYALLNIDNVDPVVEISQDGWKVNVKATDDNEITEWQVSTAEAGTTYSDCNIGGYTDIDRNSIKKSQNTASVFLDLNDHGKTYCVKVVDSQSNTGYSNVLVVDTRLPILTANQDNAVLTISVRQDDDKDGIDDGNDDINDDSWQYAIVNSIGGCNYNLSNWQNISKLTDDANENRALITLTTSTDDHRYCFRVADNSGNYGYVYIDTDSINSPPRITNLVQTHDMKISMTAVDNNYIDSSTWQYSITNSDICNSQTSGWQKDELTTKSSSTTQGTASIDLSELSLDREDESQWICVRVADNLNDNYGYKNKAIDIVAPSLQVIQRSNVLRASGIDNQQGIQSSSWRYVKDSNDFDCDEDAFDIYTNVRSSVVNLRSSDIGNYYCFKASDRYNNIGYTQTVEIKSLDTTPPIIKVVQNNDILVISATNNNADIDEDNWGYRRMSKTQPRNCNTQSSYSFAEDGVVDLQESDEDYWFCVRGSDKHDNYGYSRIKVREIDATIPVVTIEQRANKLLASSDARDLDKSSWQYVRTRVDQHDFDCSNKNTQLNFNDAKDSNNEVVLSEADHNRYYCFRVKDRSGNFGYGMSQQVIFNAPPQLSVLQKSHLKRLEVSTTATDVDGYTWAWVNFNYNPGDCSTVDGYIKVSDSNLESNTNQIVVSDIPVSKDGSYYCFRVADTSDGVYPNYGYIKHRYDLSQPLVKFDFNTNTNVLTVFSSSPDVNHNTWRYATYINQPTCDANDDLQYRVPNSRQFTLTSADNSHWLCFKVADSAGNYAYGLYLISGVDDDTTPEIDIHQSRNIIIATSASSKIVRNSWRYIITIDEPYCGANNGLSFSYNNAKPNEVDLSQISQNYNWVCFKVSDEYGSTGYAKVKIDRQPPVINLDQNNVVLNAESSDEDLDTDSWRYIVSKDDISCQNARLTAIDADSTKISFDLTSEDEALYYCISVADKTGYRSFKKVQIAPLDFEAPSVKVSQTGRYLKVDAKDVDTDTWMVAVSSKNASGIDCSSEGELEFKDLIYTTLTLSEADNGKWYCFRVTNDNNVDGYGKILVNNIDTTSPKIEIVQQDESVMTKSDEEIAKWQYVILEEDTACNKEAFSNQSTIFEGDQFTLTNKDNGKTYCFRAYDKAGNLTYKSITADLEEEATTPVVVEAPQDDNKTEEDDTSKVESTNDEDDDNNLILIITAIVVGVLIVSGAVIWFITSKKDDDSLEDVDNYL